MDTHNEEHEYAYKNGQHFIDIAYKNPSDELKNAIQYGVFEFAAYDHREVLLLCYCVKGAVEWKTIPYNIHFSDTPEVTLPRYPFSFHDKVKIHVRLRCLNTDEVHVQRTLALPRNFSLELVSALRRQSSYPFDSNNFSKTHISIDSEHRAVEDIVENSNVRCIGESASSKTIANIDGAINLLTKPLRY